MKKKLAVGLLGLAVLMGTIAALGISAKADDGPPEPPCPTSICGNPK